MIMERTAVGRTTASYPFPLGTTATGRLPQPLQPRSSTLAEVMALDRMLGQVLEVLEAFGAEQDIPEVFNLEPLEKRQVTLRVRSVRPADFYFVDDGAQDVDL